MTERTDDVETRNEDETEHEERVYSPDGGVVASAPAASTPTEAVQQPTIGEDPSQEELEPRTKRARNEEMDVSLLQKGGIYDALLQRRIAPVSALFSADFREACGEVDAVLRYEVETTDHTAV